MKKNVRKIIVVLGPTSSGKSDLAVELARKYNSEIISADSRQIYQDMNLGTGKVEGAWQNQLPTTSYQLQINSKHKTTNSKCRKSANSPFENTGVENHLPSSLKLWRAGNPPLRKGEDNKNGRVYVFDDVKHHLIDFVSPADEYNISHFKKDCEKLIKKISDEGKTPIICGGTGFWIQAVVYDQILPEVKPDERLRKDLEDKTAEELLVILQELDPARAKSVDIKNKIRLIRAIEIAKKLGKVPKPDNGNYEIIKIPLSPSLKLRRASEPTLRKGEVIKTVRISKNDEIWEFLQLGISLPKEELSEKIEKRLRLRFHTGLIDEVKKLKEKYNLDWKKIQSFGLAYFWVPKFLKGEIDEKELRQRVFLAERQYAKRQMTWFKKDKGVNWLVNENKKAIKITGKFLGLAELL